MFRIGSSFFGVFPVFRQVALFVVGAFFTGRVEHIRRTIGVRVTLVLFFDLDRFGVLGHVLPFLYSSLNGLGFWLVTFFVA